MAKPDNYWFEEGEYAYKAGIDLSELERHYPERDMGIDEWNALEKGWVATRLRQLEQMGQTRLF